MTQMRCISLFCISLLIFIFTSQVALNSDVIGTTVNIPDANLESALRLQLGIPSDPLTDSDLASVTHLSVHTEIANLEGLEYCDTHRDRQSRGIGVLWELGAS